MSDILADVAIIGHKGRMGNMLYSKLRRLGYNVCGIDLPLEDTYMGCAGANVVLLCVPAAVLYEVCCKIVPYMKDGAILADITSVKVKAMTEMQKAWTGAVVGTHPLFGPAITEDMDLPCVLTMGEKATLEHYKIIESIFTHMGCRVFESSAKLHDEAMAAIQGLNFISNLAYFATLAHREEYLPFITPSFIRRKDSAQKSLTDDAQMFEGLFEANPYSQEMVRKFRGFLALAAGGDISLLLHRADWWWNGHKQ